MIRIPRSTARYAAPALAALTLAVGLVLPPASRAATPPQFAKLLQGLDSARSYRATMSMSSTGGPDDPSSMALQEVVVRTGKTFDSYLRISQRNAKGKATTMEMVLGSAHTCFRLASGGPWNCRMGSMAAPIGSASMLSSAVLKQMSVTPLDSKVVLGQLCDGFAISYHASPELQSQGVLWVSRATALPVEEQGTSVIALSYPAKSVSRSTFTGTWSNWNDPRLSIPVVPGA